MDKEIEYTLDQINNIVEMSLSARMDVKFNLKYLLSKVLRTITKEIARKRHYDLEEYDHESKLMSVGYNKGLEDCEEVIGRYINQLTIKT